MRPHHKGLLHCIMSVYTSDTSFATARSAVSLPRLREMHAHVPIRPEDAEDWLHCMDLALTDTGVEEPLRGQIFQTFGRAARMLVNREAGAAAE